MPRATAVACSIVLVAMVAGPCLAAPPQPSPVAVLYDDFSGGWLDSKRWAPVNDHCWNSCLESVREVTGGQLRLVSRSIGQTTSDTGAAYSEAFAELAAPVAQAVTTLQADVLVRGFGGVDCPANTSDFTHTQVMVGGRYFNSGAGDWMDDVMAWLILWVDTRRPSTMDVGLWWGTPHPEDPGNWTFITRFPRETVLVNSLSWDQANHQFVGTVAVKGGAAPALTVAAPYGVSDDLPASTVNRQLVANVAALNCTSAQTTGFAEAIFDNVSVR